MKLSDQLPPIYSRFLPQELLSFDPKELKATCHKCAMAKENGHRGKTFYQANLKCCTYEPFIPNFMVGAILKNSANSAGAEVIQQKIVKREYALPIGLVPSVRYQLQFKENKEKIFGKDPEYLCSFYDVETQLCTIWRQRGNVCTTFHCKSSYGVAGKKFWNQFGHLLSYVEQILLEEALIQLDFSPRQVSELFGYLNRESGTVAEHKTWVLPEKKARELWNGYFDEQIQFYIKAFEIAEKMSKKDFSEMMGDTGHNLLELVLEQKSHLVG
ncbi:MAG: hypothetical protein ACLGGX_07640 [Bdellovibrionia bacterium]